MDEIVYIARIDGRPWAATEKVKSFIPFVLMFASVETTRYLLNSHTQVSEFEKYFVMAVAAIFVVLAQDSGIIKWRSAYTTKMVQDVVFCILMSSALFNVASAFLPKYWVSFIDPEGMLPEWAFRIALSCALCAAGVGYVILRTQFHRAAEFRRLHARPAAHHFMRFRERECRCLVGVYAAYYVAASALLSYLLIRSA